VRALALHPDVLLVTSALFQVNCVIVRAVYDERSPDPSGAGTSSAEFAGESFVIDSPVLPDELDALPTLLQQAHYPEPSGLLATHGDWDHLLGGLAFPGAVLGCAEPTAERLAGAPGEAQRTLRRFDEELLIERARPLALGSVQALPVPGHCAVGEQELELHPTGGHTPDGMAVRIGWAGVLVCGDHLSSVELPTMHDGGDAEAYLATLERLRPLVQDSDHIVPGHGPMLDSARALAVLEEDLAYLKDLLERGMEAELPRDRRSAVQRQLHAKNVAALTGHAG
jgi:glyoxylase-like metal-dependent hydrolase (beta-lactamase superfamily II)